MASPLSRLARMQQELRAGAARATGVDLPRPKPVLEARPAAPSRPVTPPSPQPVLSQDYIQFLLNKVEDNGLESLTPNEVALLSRSFENTAQVAPAPSAIDDVQIEAPDLNGNLAASDLELDPPASAGGTDNLRPKKAKGPTQLEKLANEINQIAGSARTGEAVAPRQSQSTWRKVSALSSDDFAELVRVMGNEESALAKLEQVQNIGGDAIRDPNSLAAAALDRAKQAREGTMRAQGSNSPEFATDRLTDADMPTAADTARAVERERQVELSTRSPGGGPPLAERIAMAGLDPDDPQAARKLPLWLKGRDDRPTALESRSRGSRSLESNDIKVLRPLIQAREELAAATTPEQQSKALAKVTAAEEALDRKYPRGRQAMPDSRLNKGGQMETFNDLVIAWVGGRPKAGKLGRPSDGLSAMEKQALDAEALDAYGPDAFEFLPDEQEIDNVSDVADSGKPKKVRGRPLPSRSMGAEDVLFAGGGNPIHMAGSAEAVADIIMKKQTVFRPGTADYDMARERAISRLKNKFGGEGPTAITPQQAAERPAPFSSEPESVDGMTQDPAAVPALEGRANAAGEQPVPPSRPDFSMPAMSPLQTPSPAAGYVPEPSQFSNDPNAPAVWQDKSVRRSTAAAPVANAPQASSTARRRAAQAAARQSTNPSVPIGPPAPAAKTAEELALEASAINIDPAAATGASGPQRTRMSNTEIKQAANKARDEAYRTAIDEGMSEADARAAARQVGDKVRKELLDANAVAVDAPANSTPDASNPIGGAAPSSGSAPRSNKNTNPSSKKTTAKQPKDAETAEPKDGTDAKKADDKANPEKGPPKKGIPYFRTALGAGGVIAGTAGLSWLGSGKSGTASAGDGPVLVPPGGAAGAEAEMSEEDAINRALARLRGSRAGSDSPTYQTVQNWTVWR